MSNMKKIVWELHWSSNPMEPIEQYWGNIEGLDYIIECDQRYFNYNVYFDDSGECCYFDKIVSNMKVRKEDLKLLVELHANMYLDKDGYL